MHGPSNATREIRAVHSATQVRVYQAFCPAIADAALAAQTFVPPFGMGRMTWIKPSFNWMRDRCGDASKPNQERVLAVEITREGFDWALERAVLSTFDVKLHGSQAQWKALLAESDVRAQWDPDRDDALRPLPDRRAIQIGLRDEAVRRYVEWIVAIADVTAATRKPAERASMVAAEHPYPMPPAAAARLLRPRGGDT